MKKVRLVLVIFTFFLGQSANAQSSYLKWQKCLGGSDWDEAHSVQQTSDGGYIVAGSTESNDGDITGNHGGDDCWIVKLNTSGNILWQKCLGGSANDNANSVQQTSDGGYIVAGSTASNDGDVTGNHGSGDYWIVKLNNVGNIVWQKCLGGSAYEVAYSIQQTTDGGYIVAGFTFSNDGDVTGNHGLRDYWIVKLNNVGNIVWQKCLGGSSYEDARSVHQTSDNGYIIAGTTYSNDGDVTGNHGSRDYWIVNLNPDGNIVWQKCLGGSGYDEAYSVDQTSDGGYMVAGYSESNNGNVSGNHGEMDYWIVKLNQSGNIIWQKCLGGSSSEYAESVQQTSDGGCIVTGYTGSNNGDVTGNHGNSDYWIVKLDNSSTIVWQKCLGGSSYDDSYSVHQNSDGDYIVAGRTMSNDGDVTGNHGGYFDCWITKLGYVSVITPNGGENWGSGSNHNITWTIEGLTNVKIEYSINNGNTWITIVSSYNAAAGSYSWSVPYAISTQCKVRVSDAENPSCYDQSDNVFTIYQPVTITSPNGAENWGAGTNQNITWTNTGLFNVKIEYTIDNGSTWTTIVSSYNASTGSYSWSVPYTLSTQCKIRISDVDNALVYDESDNLFTIYSIINVTSPNGGENWQALSYQLISWTSNGISFFKIEYTTDNGNTWNLLYNFWPEDWGTYDWQVPNIPSTQCKVRISDANNNSVFDESDNVFTIEPPVTVISPNGGENWPAGSIQNITWTASFNPVTIMYSTDNGTSWTTIVSNYSTNYDYYGWLVPNTPSTQCKVRICKANDFLVYDDSDTMFTISTNSPPITVTSPNGGENWQVASTQNITWNSTGISNVKIEYTTNNGSTWTTIISSYNAGIGSYSWVLPNTPSNQCKVRVRNADNNSVFDESDNVFTISTSGQSIALTNPNGGENWQVGSAQNITWSSSGISNVKIEYTTNNGSSWISIISSYNAGTGTYSWVIPNTPSTQCKVRISDAINSSIFDESDNVFTIGTTSQSITITNPNGGENWLAGSTHDITWNSSGISNVKIEYTTDNSTSWTTVISNYPTSGGSYAWLVPNTPSTQCKVRVSDASNQSTNDLSDNVFTISGGSQSITVTNPNGGENWQVGSVNNITWNTVAINNVKIEYTTNNGASWTTIISSFPAIAGFYTWIVPNVPSTLCKIRISDSGNPSVFDVSDDTFTISTSSQFVTVTIPNGGETWQVGSAQNIVWNSSGILNVKIEYTVNNGANWTTIIQSFPASAGSYTWAVPNAPSDQCKVKITDIGNPSLFDVSDNTFTIGTGGQSTPEICIVSVDSITNKNQVVWEEPYSTTISHYNIYREGNQANVYELIGSVPYNDVSVFTDLNSYPRQQANRYKISVVDIYNVETSLSNYHNTIHLSINQGAGNEFNLMWNHYEGFSYPSYNLYRGTSQNDMVLFASISSTVNAFTDLYPPGGYVYYVIEVVKTNPCSPSRTEITSSRSNIGSNDPNVSIKSPLLNKRSVQVYPNPTTGVVNIVSNQQMDKIVIYSIMGKVLKQIYTDETSISLDFSNEPKGVYILKVISNNSVWEGKVVMQ